MGGRIIVNEQWDLPHTHTHTHMVLGHVAHSQRAGAGSDNRRCTCCATNMRPGALLPPPATSCSLSSLHFPPQTAWWTGWRCLPITNLPSPSRDGPITSARTRARQTRRASCRAGPRAAYPHAARACPSAHPLPHQAACFALVGWAGMTARIRHMWDHGHTSCCLPPAVCVPAYLPPYSPATPPFLPGA